MKGYKHLTEEQRETVLLLHRHPTQTTVIAQRLGISQTQVRHTIRKAGLKPHSGKGGACYQNVRDIRCWAADGVALSEIARRLGTTNHRVKDFLTKHQIPYLPFRQSGSNNPAWKNGETIDKRGYVLVHQPNHPAANSQGYVRKHRLVMEQILGRSLRPDEVVHHIDDNPANNDPANLRLYDCNGDHLSETRKGKIPNWSEDGYVRVLEACRRGRESPRRSNRKAKTTDGPT